MVSPSTCSILITSAPMSASIRVQCGPAIVVEKSSTRRPAKLFVKLASSFAAIVIDRELPPARARLKPRRDPKLRGPTGEAFPSRAVTALAEARLDPHFNREAKLESFLHNLRSERVHEGAF